MENKVNIENNISLDCNIAYFAKVNFKIESGYIFRDLKIGGIKKLSTLSRLARQAFKRSVPRGMT